MCFPELLTVFCRPVQLITKGQLMAMNLLNPIQLLRGTSAAIAAAQGKEGTLYMEVMY